MPPTPTASVSYKKQNGTLTISSDHKYVFFTPPGASSPAVTIPVADITNLQQTPASTEKVALKIVVDKENYVLSFTSKQNARKEQESVTDTLRSAIAANKAPDVKELVAPSASAAGSSAATPKSQHPNDGQSAAMAIAKAVSSKAADEGWYDDAKLRSDIQLQRSLLESNKSLQARFNEALHEKPDGVSISQFTSQFWSARLHLLRAHAIEKAQKQGEYNVLPEIRFTRVPAEKEGEPDTKRLDITKEQIKLIFKQYPVVSEAYNANVPPLDASQFWQRFFGSRLLKKLKGEKIVQQDPTDPILDRYLDRPEGGPASIASIPHFIDLEGNEQNHSQRKGNRPDQDMRPSAYDKVPILRVLNNLSENMLSHVAPEDGEAHAPIGMDEETYELLRLRDLASDEEDHRVKLNVREQKRYMGGLEDDLSEEAKRYSKQDPSKVLNGLRKDLRPAHFGSDDQGTLRLDRAIGYLSDSESDSEDEASAAQHTANGTASRRRPTHVSSHAALGNATSSILSSIKARRTAASSDPNSLRGLTQSTFDQLQITHNTTTEFLHYFWTLFLSGDASRTGELAQLVQTLDRSLERIRAVADKAEDERNKKIDGLKRQIQDYYQRTGKRRKLDLEGLGGGKAVVDAMIKPTVDALGVAANAYRKALEEQTAEMAVS